MRKICKIVVFLLALPSFAVHANQAAVWYTNSAPEAFWGTIPVIFPGTSGGGLLLFGVEGSSSTGDWEAWVGSPKGANSWTMSPATTGIESNLNGTWVTTGETTAEFRVTSCSQECGPFVPGATIKFTRMFHTNAAPPSPTPSPGVNSGTYESDTFAYEACLNVSSDGRRLTSTGSACDNRNSLDIEIEQGTSSLGGSCNTNVNISEDVTITGNSFTTNKSVSNPWFTGKFQISGTFSGNTVSGTLSGQGSYIPGICTGKWTATLR